MSRLYRNLAEYYDQLFPLNPITLDFVRSVITVAESHILDIGSATGQLSMALVTPAFTPSKGTVKSVTAIDPDEKMVTLLIEKSLQKKLDSKLTVLTGGMSEVDSLFNSDTFHTIFCLGNTLVHLTTLDDIQRFFHSVFSRLKKRGVFIFQIVNYTLILTQNIQELPFIDKPSVSLTRHYHYNKSNHLIQFRTRMTLKETDEVIESEISLYPLEYHQLVPIIHQTGFETIACMGSFNREPWESNSPALVMALKKK